MKALATILLAAAILAASSASAKSSDLDETALVRGNTAFALELYNQLKDEPGNLFLSPHSISTALAMTYAGARGDTAEEMARALSFDLPTERLHVAFSNQKLSLGKANDNVEISVANALWPHQNYRFLPKYLDTLRRDYDSVGRPLNYGQAEQARQVINQWVEEETKEKIKNLIPAGVLNAMTRMVLTNAIYFKSDWASQFKKQHTREAPFKIAEGKTAKTPLMYQSAKFGYHADADVQVLDLPFKGKHLALSVLLPNQGGGPRFGPRPKNPAPKKTLADLEKILSPEKLQAWLDKLRPMKIDVWLPKFKMTSQFGLSGPLQALGMKKAFTHEADFSGMDGSKNLYVSDVLHKAFVEVNEEGAEAAAATAAIFALKSARMNPRFRADHPFLFLIRDKLTGSILFLGRYAEPPK